jgi:hypothetical protein
MTNYELCLQNRKTDEKYIKPDKEYGELFDKIRVLLGENQELMLELEALGNQKGGIDDEMLYKQGMIDCVKILKTIRMI